MEFECAKCGKIHKGLTAIAFITPFHFDVLSKADKGKMATINNDFCVIEHEDQTDYFIRTTLNQKIIDSCETLDYGLWVSLSEKNYEDYSNNFKNENHVKTYFGYLCNLIPEYKDCLNIKMNVITQKGNSRPIIIPHQDQMENRFVFDYFNGIGENEALRRINSIT